MHHIFINSLKDPDEYKYQLNMDTYHTDVGFILVSASEKIQNNNFLRDQKTHWKALVPEKCDEYTSIWKDLSKLIRENAVRLIKCLLKNIQSIDRIPHDKPPKLRNSVFLFLGHPDGCTSFNILSNKKIVEDVYTKINNAISNYLKDVTCDYFQPSRK